MECSGIVPGLQNTRIFSSLYKKQTDCLPRGRSKLCRTSGMLFTKPTHLDVCSTPVGHSQGNLDRYMVKPAFSTYPKLGGGGSDLKLQIPDTRTGLKVFLGFRFQLIRSRVQGLWSGSGHRLLMFSLSMYLSLLFLSFLLWFFLSSLRAAGRGELLGGTPKESTERFTPETQILWFLL